jgi:hypothetical protein
MAENKAGSPYPSFLKIAGVAGLFSLNAYFWGSPFLGIVLSMVAGVIIFIIALLLIRRTLKRDTEARNDEFAIIGYNYTKEYNDKDDVKRMQPERVMGFVKKIDISRYLSTKANYNATIIGTAGSGKTELTYYFIRHLKRINPDGSEVVLKKIIFQYKDSDKYKNLGYPTILLKDNVPNVFEDPDAFVQAWICAFPIGTIGITAGKIPVLIKEVMREAKNFEEFESALNKKIDKERDDIRRSTLQDILDKLPLIYSRKMINYELPNEVVLDFEGTSKEAFVFYAEYILRMLHREILNGKRENTIIMIDEASLFNKAGNTIIPEIAKLIRSRGALLVATQSISTITGDILDNCDTQLISVQTGSDNLREASAISNLYHYALTQLGRYDFIDFRQRESDKEIYIFRLLNPSNEFVPIKVIMAENSGKAVRAEETINFKDEVQGILENEASNIQGIAKRMALKHGKELNREGIDYFKVRIQPILSRFMREGKVNSVFMEGVKTTTTGIIDVDEKVYYWSENKGSYHDYLVSRTADVLKAHGLKCEILPSGKNTADIEGDDFVIECETGLKHSTDDLRERIEKYRHEGKATITIIPNSQMRDRYPEGKTLKEFRGWIENLLKVAGVRKEDENEGRNEEGDESV